VLAACRSGDALTPHKESQQPNRKQAEGGGFDYVVSIILAYKIGMSAFSHQEF
jgi:hypothetical protein